MGIEVPLAAGCGSAVERLGGDGEAELQVGLDPPRVEGRLEPAELHRAPVPDVVQVDPVVAAVVVMLGLAVDDLRQPPKTATSRKPISNKDVAFRTSFGLGPEKTENQGPNRERKAGGWGESMVRRGALERCETGANPLETRGKRKPVYPENHSGETGCHHKNGGGGGESNPRPKRSNHSIYARVPCFILAHPTAHRQAIVCASGHGCVACAPATQTHASLLNDTSPPSRRQRFRVTAILSRESQFRVGGLVFR